MHDWLQIAIGGLIVCAVLFTAWKHGKLNPDSTGALGSRLSKLETRQKRVEDKLEGCATTGALGILSAQVASLEAHAASSGEVSALELKVMGVCDTLGAKIDGVAKAADRTEDGVRRIEGYFLAKGVNGQ